MNAFRIDRFINRWIRENNFELIDVKLHYYENKTFGDKVNVTIIYLDKNES